MCSWFPTKSTADAETEMLGLEFRVKIFVVVITLDW